MTCQACQQHQQERDHLALHLDHRDRQLERLLEEMERHRPRSRQRVLNPIAMVQDLKSATLPVAFGFRMDEPADWLKVAPGLQNWNGTVNNSNMGIRIWAGPVGNNAVGYITQYNTSGLVLVHEQYLIYPDLVPWQRWTEGLVEVYATANPGANTSTFRLVLTPLMDY